MLSPLEKYLESHCAPQSEALDWIERQTNIKTNFPQMLSGKVQGCLLTILAKLTGAKSVLEIGAFTGYSTVCIAAGLPQDGHIDSLEINDELEYILRGAYRKAGIEDMVTLHIGDACETLKSLKDSRYDFVYIDADKRRYCDFYDLLIDLVVPGGCILADDVLWDGKVFADPVPQDRQTVGITAFNDKVAADPRVESVILPLRDGLTIIRKK